MNVLLYTVQVFHVDLVCGCFFSCMSYQVTEPGHDAVFVFVAFVFAAKLNFDCYQPVRSFPVEIS